MEVPKKKRHEAIQLKYPHMASCFPVGLMMAALTRIPLQKRLRLSFWDEWSGERKSGLYGVKGLKALQSFTSRAFGDSFGQMGRPVYLESYTAEISLQTRSGYNKFDRRWLVFQVRICPKFSGIGDDSKPIGCYLSEGYILQLNRGIKDSTIP